MPQPRLLREQGRLPLRCLICTVSLSQTQVCCSASQTQRAGGCLLYRHHRTTRPRLGNAQRPIESFWRPSQRPGKQLHRDSLGGRYVDFSSDMKDEIMDGNQLRMRPSLCKHRLHALHHVMGVGTQPTDNSCVAHQPIQVNNVSGARAKRKASPSEWSHVRLCARD
ncbi:hypothetical protein C7974DRAFT_222969 [Boeremia exigua]|uniref:uncharacterized protein n=1 Tax=Boeremia exigua TaxID=749465 RepID=UPI001E8DF61C|nr:uncharacterized protein C7974DRAFT_222969 [Boeremia exigua]KAH6619905.1 hypothetical protein C7974DRAFT_222969 [Boeremia exigua]